MPCDTGASFGSRAGKYLANNVCSIGSTTCTKNVASICAKNGCSFGSSICNKNVASICARNGCSFCSTICAKKSFAFSSTGAKNVASIYAKNVCGIGAHFVDTICTENVGNIAENIRSTGAESVRKHFGNYYFCFCCTAVRNAEEVSATPAKAFGIAAYRAVRKRRRMQKAFVAAPGIPFQPLHAH